MNWIKQNMGGLVVCLFEILVGILLFVNPVGFTAGIIIGLGIVLLVNGIANIIRYLRTDCYIAATERRLASGLMAVVGGGFCVLKYQWFIVTFPILTILYGIVVLVVSLYKVQITVDMLRMKRGKWGWAAASAFLSLAFAITILANPFGSTLILWRFTSATLVFEAVLDMLVMIFSAHPAEKI